MEHRIAYSACPGTYHQSEEVPCQDVAAGRKWGTCAAVALADGAGSCRFSQNGAETAVQTVLELLEENWNQWIEEDLSAIAQQIIDRCLENLSKAPYKAEEQSSTLLFCAVGDDGTFLCGHIGDGFIFRASNGGTIVLSSPENGEEPNETIFVTSPHAAAHLRLQRGTLLPGDAVFLCSDGAGEALFARDTGECAPAIGKMREWFSKYSEEDICNALEYNLNNVLRQESSDDMSVAMIWIGESEGA